MIGQLKFTPKGKGKPEWGPLYGMPVLRTAAEPEGLRRAGRTLRLGGTPHVLAPKGFERWSLLRSWGLSPVDPTPLLRAQCAPLAVEALRRQGVDPGGATVALRGLRADRDMERAAVRLCAQVRRLVISAPRGGKEMAQWLRWEFGVPILPEDEGAALALRFAPGSFSSEDRALELYGLQPDLAGLSLSAPELEEEDQDDLNLLTALWQGGKLGEGDLKIT